MERSNSFKIKYEHLRYAWLIYTCISIILCVFSVALSWSALVFLWIMVAEICVTFLINYLRHMEEDLSSQAMKAKRAERSKTDFLANMSHEIRTPMNAIVGMCELTLRESNISKTVRENCNNIQSSGRSLLSIINDILDFSKIDSGKMEIIEEEFNIASTINDVINMAMTRKGNKDIEIIVDIDPDIPVGLYGDELRIRQIIINILTNAIKFTKEGSVELKVTRTKHDYGINLSIAVIDTGIGITEENLEKLFTSFQQVDTRKNRSVEGTGLGLAISKRLATRMGGFINVRSKYGKGSEFKLTLPLAVTNEKPFIKVKNAENLHVVSYFDFSKFNHEVVENTYNELMSVIGKGLKVDFHNFPTFETLSGTIAKYSDRITHCFIGKEEYLGNKDYFITLSSYLDVVLIQDKINAIEPEGNIRVIYKPFYALSIAAALNNESLIDLNDNNKAGNRFIAPKARVLIVDDNEINREVAAGLMRPYGMQIVTVDSGPSAIKALKNKDFHLVFMDHMMPEMDGVEVTRIIRSMPDIYYKKLPIVALTANAISGVKEMFINAGFSDFMAKPIELNVLDRMLKSWLPDKLLQKHISTEKKEEKAVENRPATTYFSPDQGIVYCGGDVAAYENILSIFVRNGNQKKNYIESLFKTSSWNNYIIEVHALKSSARSIGAIELSELAKKIEHAGREEKYDFIYENESELISLYSRVIEECRSYLYQYGSENSEEVNIADFNFRLELEESMLEIYVEDIASACDLYDGEEISRLCSEAGMFSFGGKSLKHLFEEVKSFADDFEFEKALSAVELIPQKAAEWSA